MSTRPNQLAKGHVLSQEHVTICFMVISQVENILELKKSKKYLFFYFGTSPGLGWDFGSGLAPDKSRVSPDFQTSKS